MNSTSAFIIILFSLIFSVFFLVFKFTLFPALVTSIVVTMFTTTTCLRFKRKFFKYTDIKLE